MIGVVGAAKGNFGFMIFGLVLSVILTGAMATYLASYIQKHLWIAYVGLGFYSFSSPSISNWRFSRLRNFIDQRTI